jgi:hypothetical protein
MSATDLGHLAAGDAQQLVVARREDVVRVPAGGPDDVVLRQADVDDGAQRFGMPDGGDAAHGFCNSWGIPGKPTGSVVGVPSWV